MTVRLDVTGAGTGTIRFSGAAGTRTTPAIALNGWSYTYTTTSTSPIVLEVVQPGYATADCAVHIDGTLRASDSASNPTCSVSPV